MPCRACRAGSSAAGLSWLIDAAATHVFGRQGKTASRCIKRHVRGAKWSATRGQSRSTPLRASAPANSQTSGGCAVTCSKGTYVRVLVEDIAAKLGTIAVMSALRRTASGDFTLAMAHPLPAILQAAEQGQAEELLLGVDGVFSQLARLECRRFFV